MRALTEVEMDEVSGGGWEQSGIALGLMTGIGATTFGATWGAMVVGTAFAMAPVAVIAMGGLALYAGVCALMP